MSTVGTAVVRTYTFAVTVVIDEVSFFLIQYFEWIPNFDLKYSNLLFVIILRVIIYTYYGKY